MTSSTPVASVHVGSIDRPFSRPGAVKPATPEDEDEMHVVLEDGQTVTKKDEVDVLVSRYKRNGYEDSDDSDDEMEDSSKKRPKHCVDRPAFNGFIGVVIALNALVIGLETDLSTSGNDAEGGGWVGIEVTFVGIFMFELCLRIYVHRLRFFLPMNQRMSNWIDFSLVMLSVVDTFILVPANAGGTARLASMLRLVRLARLVRLVRLFKIFKELWLVAYGLVSALRILVWVCVVLVAFCYICAIFVTGWIGHNNEVYDPYFRSSGGWDHEVYFATCLRSMITLFQVATLDQWSDHVVRHVIKNQPIMFLFFLGFLSVTTFGFLNIIIGVIVESTMNAADRDAATIRKAKERDRQLVFGQLRDIFEAADVDKSGTLDLDEVKAALSKTEIFNKLKMIDFPVEDPDHIFHLLDYDESGELSIEEFITGCLRMKGQAKSKDLLVAQVAIDSMRRHCEACEKELDIFNGKLGKLLHTAQAVVDHGEHLFLDMRRFRKRHAQAARRASSVPVMRTSRLERAPWEVSLAEMAELMDEE